MNRLQPRIWSINRSALRWLLALTLLIGCSLTQQGAAQELKQPDLSAYNFVVGTQTIGSAYGFTGEDRLVETATEILKMGSATLKFTLTSDEIKATKPSSLTEVARSNPAVKKVLAMPFSHVLMWAYPIQQPADGLTNPLNGDANYREIYDLTRYLLTTYCDTGKTFYLGNWEGDWHLLNTDPSYSPSPDEIKNMIAWVNLRQKAVDDAKRDTPHLGVQVYHYLEVNRVQDAMAGKPRLANLVLPETDVDFVSYSSYDSLDDIEKKLPAALDYLASHLKPKAGISGQRVWIGEYGFPTDSNTPEQQDEKSRRVMRTAINWGCPFVLYWEFYNNEVSQGKQKGFWLVDDKNVKQPVYFTHQKFLSWAKSFVVAFEQKEGRLPTSGEFKAQAQKWLSQPVDGLEEKRARFRASKPFSPTTR